MISRILKSLIIGLLGFLCLYLMQHWNLINFSEVGNSFRKHPKLILCAVLLQILVCFLAAIRYLFLLRVFETSVGLKNVLTSTFIGNAVGQWFPGSLAFIEMIRYGLVLGSTHKLDHLPTNKAGRLACASLFDRLIGLYVMFLFGFMSSAYVFLRLWRTQHSFDYTFYVVGIVCFVSLISTLFMSFLPQIVTSSFFNKICSTIPFCKRVQRIFLSADLQSKKTREYALPLLLSLAALICMNFSTFFCAQALSGHIPLTAIFSTVALVSISTLLPLGIGGIGGFQLFAAFIYSVFDVSAKVAAHAQLLQNLINLLSLSLAALFFIPHGFQHMKGLWALLNREKNSEK